MKSLVLLLEILPLVKNNFTVCQHHGGISKVSDLNFNPASLTNEPNLAELTFYYGLNKRMDADEEEEEDHKAPHLFYTSFKAGSAPL